MTLVEFKDSAHAVWDALEPVKVPLDFAFIGLLVTALLNVIPGITAIVTLAWSLIRLFETATVQAWLARRRQRKELR